ncbi:MAG TPA: hypothetical protein VKR52_04230 [Terracidiphilus sp.]|nr:hypothetical protein [Terracidiphilus sp.]
MKIPVQEVSGGVVRTVTFDVQPKGATQKTSGRTTVEEINGGQRSTRVFAAPDAGGHSSRAGSRRSRKNTQPVAERVEVSNGGNSYTTTFKGPAGAKESAERAPSGQHVVTGIESSRLRAGVEKSQPLVVGVSSGESENANAKPVVVAVASSGVESNRPVSAQAPSAPRHSKRRPYMPNPPSR